MEKGDTQEKGQLPIIVNEAEIRQMHRIERYTTGVPWCGVDLTLTVNTV